MPVGETEAQGGAGAAGGENRGASAGPQSPAQSSSWLADFLTPAGRTPSRWHGTVGARFTLAHFVFELFSPVRSDPEGQGEGGVSFFLPWAPVGECEAGGGPPGAESGRLLK